MIVIGCPFLKMNKDFPNRKGQIPLQLDKYLKTIPLEKGCDIGGMTNMAIPTLICMFVFAVAVCLAIPLGRYLSLVYQGKRSLLDFLQPLENRLYRFCRINEKAGMNWKQYLSAISTKTSFALLPVFCCPFR